MWKTVLQRGTSCRIATVEKLNETILLSGLLNTENSNQANQKPKGDTNFKGSQSWLIGLRRNTVFNYKLKRGNLVSNSKMVQRYQEK